MDFTQAHLTVIHRPTDEYHAAHIVDTTGGLVTEVPLRTFVLADDDEVAENLDNSRWLRRSDVWEVTDANGKHRAFVRPSNPPYHGLVLASQLLGEIMAYRGMGHSSVNREAALKGIYLSTVPRETRGMTEKDAQAEAQLDALLQAKPDCPAPFRLRAMFDPKLPERMAWLPSGFTVQGNQVVWHPAPPEEVIPDW